jgi:hypothetical protein
MVFACCCGRGAEVSPVPLAAEKTMFLQILRYGQQLVLKKFYHDPTRYLSSQYLGAIDAQEGSFNVS